MASFEEFTSATSSAQLLQESARTLSAYGTPYCAVVLHSLSVMRARNDWQSNRTLGTPGLARIGDAQSRSS
jgi:hypothetical protein